MALGSNFSEIVGGLLTELSIALAISCWVPTKVSRLDSFSDLR